jgi:hypothetical protein
MESPEFEEPLPSGWDCSEGPSRTGNGAAGSLREIAQRLESDPHECWHALEGLAAVELEVRLAIIDELSRHPLTPGARTLLRLISTSRDRATRTAARVALLKGAGKSSGDIELDAWSASVEASDPGGALGCAVGARSERFDDSALASGSWVTRLSCCLATPVDGMGRGSIVLSVNHAAQRRTAAYLCDVRHGICGVVGEVEAESSSAGGLLELVDRQAGANGARDVPELAIGLLAGSLMLCRSISPAVRDWIEGTLGRAFQPRPFPATVPGADSTSIPWQEMPARVHALFESCPSWLDASPLTFELAEEISLREDRPAPLPDPERDAGLYRFLFEHRIIHRIELYRRMLLWMAWVWKCSARSELSRTALFLASQLSDEQCAVPSHPFAVELTTRSLRAAHGLLRTPLDPRRQRGRTRESFPL